MKFLFDYIFIALALAAFVAGILTLKPFGFLHIVLLTNFILSIIYLLLKIWQSKKAGVIAIVVSAVYVLAILGYMLYSSV